MATTNLSTISSGGTVVAGNTLIVTAGGTTQAWTIAGTEIVSSGGIDSGANVNPGGTLVVSSGGSLSGETVRAGGTAVVSAGGTMTNALLLNGGKTVVGSGGGINGINLLGGTIEIQSGAVGVVGPNTVGATQTFGFSNGGTIQLDSGVSAGNVAVGRGQTYVVSSGATAGNASIASGGLVQVQSGGQLAGVTTISGGGRVALNGTAGPGSLNLVGSGGTVTVSGLAMPANTISGFVAGDIIDLASIAGGSITGVATTADTVTVSAGGNAYTLNVPGVGSEGYQLVADGNGGTFYEVCFAEGTRIATPDAEIEIERLVPGDLVTTLDGPRPVTWVGYRSVDLARLPNPDDGRLVRIRAGAFAEAVPHRDLLVTQEHCVFVADGAGGGNLVPARMLVNGRSVVIDRGIAAYTFYHVELAEHAILVAEGLPTESYLDTGNRANFANSEVTAIRPNLRSGEAPRNWADHAAAPLCVDRAVVEPIWTTLDSRARQLGMAAATPPAALVVDPALRLLTDAGLEIEPARSDSGRYVFEVPAGVGGLRLLSRTARPSETVGPFLDDRRALGVLVGEVAVWQRGERRVASPHLAAAALPGWFGSAGGPHRWTDGHAALPLALEDEAAQVEVEVVAAGPYLAAADAVTNVARPSIGALLRFA